MENFDGIISFLIACIELMIIINLLIFIKKNALSWNVIALIILLFLYQSLETLMCFFGIKSQLVIYSAFFVITFLPPLGLNLIWNFVKIKSLPGKLFFLPAISFVIYYAFVVEKFTLAKCTVLYATYYYPLGDLYGFFYYLPIFITVFLLVKNMLSQPEGNEKKLTKILLTGYLLTFLPMILILLIFPSAIFSVDSILCKLAFILAIFLTFFALKNNGLLKRKNTNA
ncbi:MAG: hypothetical protein V1720_19265 [bacterium]